MTNTKVFKNTQFNFEYGDRSRIILSSSGRKPLEIIADIFAELGFLLKKNFAIPRVPNRIFAGLD